MPGPDFDLDSINEVYSLEFFRFSHQDIRRILPLLQLDRLVFDNRYKCAPEMAFCLILF
ncbi:Protein of unknown function [Pyronema omphalodes CBS 100304]|uniref:Uncharacterized protein n=1 Tax=Pyronema omphalodes (strain CBS 100304) TaxID=1076935 RepID=U4LW95_PYROM|nr:Protein of unknown function [Pyronema omphalodes CBS 100304]